jgi:hypothetical protein
VIIANIFTVACMWQCLFNLAVSQCVKVITYVRL